MNNIPSSRKLCRTQAKTASTSYKCSRVSLKIIASIFSPPSSVNVERNFICKTAQANLGLDKTQYQHKKSCAPGKYQETNHHLNQLLKSSGLYLIKGKVLSNSSRKFASRKTRRPETPHPIPVIKEECNKPHCKHL